jgi:hypothetical protein
MRSVDQEIDAAPCKETGSRGARAGALAWGTDHDPVPERRNGSTSVRFALRVWLLSKPTTVHAIVAQFLRRIRGSRCSRRWGWSDHRSLGQNDLPAVAGGGGGYYAGRSGFSISASELAATTGSGGSAFGV